jgi:regulatory protein
VAEPDAFTAGIKALARRELSRAELSARLVRAGFDREDARLAIDRLADGGYQSDCRAASERARSLASRRYGDVAIRADLRRRGIGDEDVERAIAGVTPESERADVLSHRAADSAKLLSTLQRKGYTDDAIDRVADRGHTGVG